MAQPTIFKGTEVNISDLNEFSLLKLIVHALALTVDARQVAFILLLLIIVAITFICTDFIVVGASMVVLSIGSNGQIFATSAIRQVIISSVQ